MSEWERPKNDDIFGLLSDEGDIDESVYTWRGGVEVSYYLQGEKVAELDYMRHKSKMLIDAEFAREHNIEVV